MNTDGPGPLGEVDTAAVTQHEWFTSLRHAGFGRMEALYIVTRPLVEQARLFWLAEHPEVAWPQ